MGIKVIYIGLTILVHSSWTEISRKMMSKKEPWPLVDDHDNRQTQSEDKVTLVLRKLSNHHQPLFTHY